MPIVTRTALRARARPRPPAAPRVTRTTLPRRVTLVRRIGTAAALPVVGTSRLVSRDLTRSTVRLRPRPPSVRTGRAGESRFHRYHSEAYITQKNRLGGPNAVNATGPPLDPGPLQWPPEFNASFVISMRHLRWQGMQARLGPWARNVQMWNATNGHTINLSRWIQEGKTSGHASLNRGQLGCADSHTRIWEHIVHHKIKMTLILEDDANIRHTRVQAQQMRQALDEAKQRRIPWHLLYLGRGNMCSEHSRYSATLAKPKGCAGLFAYVLTFEGAKILLQHARPYRLPVDVLVASLHDRGILNAVALMPRLCYVVQVFSDTKNLH